MSKLQFNVLALILLFGASTLAVAAVNPTTAGVTSEGSMGLSLTLGSEVQISNLHDVGADFMNPSQSNALVNGGLTQTVNFCVYSTAANAAYNLSIHSANGEEATGQYKMLNVRETSASVIAATFSYNMKFIPASGTGVDQITGQDRVYGPFIGSTVPNCANTGNNATLSFLMKMYPGRPANPGTLYSDTLSVTVTPA